MYIHVYIVGDSDDALFSPRAEEVTDDEETIEKEEQTAEKVCVYTIILVLVLTSSDTHTGCV